MREHASGGALTEVTFLILLALHTPRHGYAVLKWINAQTDGRLILGAGTLYGALQHLQDREWIVPVGEDTERKKLFVVTESGRKAAQMELVRVRWLSELASHIVEGDR